MHIAQLTVNMKLFKTSICINQLHSDSNQNKNNVISIKIIEFCSRNPLFQFDRNFRLDNSLQTFLLIIQKKHEYVLNIGLRYPRS